MEGAIMKKKNGKQGKNGKSSTGDKASKTNGTRGGTSSNFETNQKLPVDENDTTKDWVDEKPTASKITNYKANELIDRIKHPGLKSLIEKLALLAESDTGSKKDVLAFICDNAGYSAINSPAELLGKLIDSFNLDKIGEQAINYLLQFDGLNSEELKKPVHYGDNVLKLCVSKALNTYDKTNSKRLANIAAKIRNKGGVLDSEDVEEFLRRAVDTPKPELLDMLLSFNPRKDLKYFGKGMLDIAEEKANDSFYQGKGYDLVVEKLKAAQFTSKGGTLSRETKVKDRRTADFMKSVKDNSLADQLEDLALQAEKNGSNSQEKKLMDRLLDLAGYMFEIKSTAQLLEKIGTSYGVKGVDEQLAKFLLNGKGLKTADLNRPLMFGKNILQKMLEESMSTYDKSRAKRASKLAQMIKNKGGTLPRKVASKLLKKAIEKALINQVKELVALGGDFNQTHWNRKTSYQFAKEKAKGNSFFSDNQKGYQEIAQFLKSKGAKEKIKGSGGMFSGFDGLLEESKEEELEAGEEEKNALEEEKRARQERKRLEQKAKQSSSQRLRKALEEAKRKEKAAKKAKEEAATRRQKAKERREKTENEQGDTQGTARKMREEQQKQENENKQKQPGLPITDLLNAIVKGDIGQTKSIANNHPEVINGYHLHIAMWKGLEYFDALSGIVLQKRSKKALQPLLVEAYWTPFSRNKIYQTFVVLKKSQYLKHLDGNGVLKYFERTIFAAQFLEQQQFVDIVENFRGNKKLTLSSSSEKSAYKLFEFAYERPKEPLHQHLMKVCTNYPLFVTKKTKEDTKRREEEEERRRQLMEARRKMEEEQQRRDEQRRREEQIRQERKKQSEEQRKKEEEEASKEDKLIEQDGGWKPFKKDFYGGMMYAYYPTWKPSGKRKLQLIYWLKKSKIDNVKRMLRETPNLLTGGGCDEVLRAAMEHDNTLALIVDKLLSTGQSSFVNTLGETVGEIWFVEHGIRNKALKVLVKNTKYLGYLKKIQSGELANNLIKKILKSCYGGSFWSKKGRLPESVGLSILKSLNPSVFSSFKNKEVSYHTYTVMDELPAIHKLMNQLCPAYKSYADKFYGKKIFSETFEEIMTFSGRDASKQRLRNIIKDKRGRDNITSKVLYRALDKEVRFNELA